MSRSEYIIWKCETLDQIREEHPTWNDNQVYRYFEVVEEKLRKKGFFD